jgi:Short C-terminal domain
MLTAGLYLGGALLLGAVVLALLNRWRRRSAEDRLTPAEQLAQFRSLYERGLLSQDEFERLRNLLGGQIRRELGMTPAAGKAGPQTGVTPTPPSANGEPPPSGGGDTGIRPA